MQSTKLINPKTAAKAAAGVTTTMPNELLPQKPAPPASALDKFRSLLKQREESAAEVDIGGGAVSLSTEDVVEIYEIVLNELTFNSKPIITDLTIIAGEQRQHGEGIADAICARIVEVPIDQKLPSLYLLDSIVKNIGHEYIRYFSSRLPEVFCEAYRQVEPRVYHSMRHLFGTWSTVFPSSVLRKIETQLQFPPQVNNQSSSLTSLRPSESSRPTHGIHVNPKYLRQLENSTADNNLQHPKGTSNLKSYGQKTAVGYDEYGSDQADAVSSQGGVTHSSLARGSNKPQPSSTSRLARRLSPSTIGAERPVSSEIDDFASGSSPQRFVEGLSPSHPLFDYGHGRTIVRDEETNGLRRKHYSDDNHNQFEASATYSLSNGHDLQGPRALIDAYGDDRGKRIPNSKQLHIERLAVNGMHNTVATRSWKNTEEEEFDWEDMSPTLSDRGRSNNFLPSSVPPFGSVVPRPGFGRLSATRSESDFKSNQSSQAPLSLVEGSNIAEDAVSILGSGCGSTSKIPEFRSKRNQITGARHPQEGWNLPPHISQSTNLLNMKGRGRDFQMPLSRSGASPLGGENNAVVENLPEIDAKVTRPPAITSRLGSNIDSNSSGTWSIIASPSSGVWPPVNAHRSVPHPVHPILPSGKQNKSQFDPVNASSIVTNHGVHKGSVIPEQPFTNAESKDYSLMKPTPLPNQTAGLNQQNQAHFSPFQPQLLLSHEARGNFNPSGIVSLPSRLLAPPLNHGYNAHGHSGARTMVSSTTLPAVQLPLTLNNMPNPLHSQTGIRPPLPPGPPPQMIPFPQNTSSGAAQPTGPAFSGLISSLMAQGLISLTKPTPIQDSVGLEFNVDLHKFRYESAISALYADLPRQCTTCGLRFKCQEEHSGHMDWHVTKNRMSKNRKQKSSRKWFVSASMWLSGAEALGTDAVPGFLPTETIVEKKDGDEMAVPADEEQSTCALCGEPFDDFYSDETEEWMYKGAVYLNAPNGSTIGMDRSQLGPIVHAKCRSDTSVVPPEDFGHEGGNSEEGSQRKRMRS